MRLPLLLLLFFPSSFLCRNISDPPEIVAVSAMCSSDGITASVDFDGPFNGKIYSLDYATVHDCLYYNALDMNTVLFSIPAHRCGTRLSRTTRNIVDQMVNRVYVQMDRDFQSSHDKQFSFVCQLADGRKNFMQNTISETRRSPLKDSYATPPPTLLPAVTPVRALSSDARQFGNWPIPGAKSYDPSMKPTPVFPRLPGSISLSKEPISPVKDFPRPFSASLPNEYIQSPVTPQKPKVELPVVPQRSPPREPILPQQPPRSSSSSFLSSDSYPRPPAYPQWPPLSSSSSFQRSPAIVPSRINKHQGIGMGLQPVKAEEEYTRVPAQTWNMGTTAGYVRRPEDQRNGGKKEDLPPTLRTENRGEESAKVFKEEPPRIGMAFTSDDNTLTDSSSPTEFLVSRQESPKMQPSDVFLEIQRGDGPFSSPVTGPVKIGENISLVVKSKSGFQNEDQYDMFVHSCFAADGPGTTKVHLTDDKGCVLRREFVGDMQRMRKGETQFYFFRISAFKFPGPDDVYFSCSIDITHNKSAPEICSSSSPENRRRRSLSSSENELRLFDIVKVELAEQWEQQRKAMESLPCVPTLSLTLLSSLTLFLLLCLLCVSCLAMSLHFRLRQLSPGF